MPQQKNTDIISLSTTNSDTGSTSTPHTPLSVDDKGVRQKVSNDIGDYEDEISQIDLFSSAPRSPHQQKKGMKSAFYISTEVLHFAFVPLSYETIEL
jgi:polysaccharide deacetylase 2 family uncharacterized protein YibQ